MDRLHRISLLLGNEAIKKLQQSSVMVIGCGAVGSFAIEALARSGVGHIILIDFDNVEESNINRQLFALDSTIGKPKVEMAKSRINQAKDTGCETLITACPFCKLNLENEDLEVLDLTEFLVKYGDLDES